MVPDDTPPHITVDTRGSFCPVPIIKLSEAVRNIDAGGVVEVVSDDPAIEFDLPAWCRSAGHTVLKATRKGGDYIFRIRKEGRST